MKRKKFYVSIKSRHGDDVKVKTSGNNYRIIAAMVNHLAFILHGSRHPDATNEDIADGIRYLMLMELDERTREAGDTNE